MGGAALTGTMRVASKLGGASKFLGSASTSIGNSAPRLAQFGSSIAQIATKARGIVTKAQTATGRAFAPVVSAVEGAQRFGTSVVAKVPVVNTVADRFATASTRLSSASAQVSAAASTVEGLAEDTVTNVMDYGMNTPVSEQNVNGYMRSASSPVVSSLVIPVATSKGVEKILKAVKAPSDFVKAGANYTGDYAGGFSNSWINSDEENLKERLKKANEDGLKDVASAGAENIGDKAKR